MIPIELYASIPLRAESKLNLFAGSWIWSKVTNNKADPFWHPNFSASVFLPWYLHNLWNDGNIMAFTTSHIRPDLGTSATNLSYDICVDITLKKPITSVIWFHTREYLTTGNKLMLERKWVLKHCVISSPCAIHLAIMCYQTFLVLQKQTGHYLTWLYLSTFSHLCRWFWQ